MNAILDHWTLFVQNVAQRLKERRTAREDERQAIGRWEAGRRLAEAGQ